MSDAPHPAATHVTPYDRLDLDDAGLVRLLASGARRAELVDYFGAAACAELAVLARRAAARRDRGGPRVYILPGIMGSQLGKARGPGLPRDILWLDPIDIAIGRLRELALRPHSAVHAMGPLIFSFLALELRLMVAGFSPRFFAYDWRRSVAGLGREFADALARDPSPRVQVVAHSMGGLVARAALALPGNERIERLVMLGTPNSGSFAPVQALRGTYSVVRKLAMLDQFHTAETLASEVYSTFPGLYELLPAEGTTRIDLFDPAVWPATGPRPDPELLAGARSALRGLAHADARMTLIAGIGRPTVTGVERAGAEFAYAVTRDGDGTVPLALAELPGVRTHYIREGHSELTTNGTVAAAIIELLRTGTTRLLPTARPAATRAAARITDRELRRTHTRKIDWHALSTDERREFLETLNDPPKPALRAAGTRAVPKRKPALPRGTTSGVLDIEIVRGDIATADADALAVGVHHGVAPAGAAAAIDAHLGGTIAEFSARRMLPGHAGQVTALPAAGRLAHATHVVIVGLGRFADLDAGTIELAADSVARFCERGGIESLATVPWGAGSGLPATLSFAAQLRGYLRQRGAAAHRLRRVVFVVRDVAGHRAIARLAASLVREADPDGLRLRLRAAPAARAAARRPAAALATAVPRIAHLLVERLAIDGATETWRAAALTPGEHAAVITEAQRFARADLDALLRQLDGERLTAAGVTRLGASLAGLVLHPNVLAALAAAKAAPLSVVNDAPTSRMPWEMLTRGDWTAALRAGLSRRYAAPNLSIARFSELRRTERTLAVLLVVNPTEDLPGAAREGARVRDLFRGIESTRLTLVEGRSATRARVLAEFESGDYDVVHYAGHAAFDPGTPRSSGLIVSDGVVTGADLVSLAQLPALVFFNACESGRVRGGAQGGRGGRRAPTSRATALEAGTSVAEAWLRAGIANFLGTYWPVGDASALACAEKFYSALVTGASIGAALLAARHAVRALPSPDWANYVHYGDPFFILKATEATTR
ncbi:MAG: hypothetical protein CMLOHMNK_00423 [Steroidobacteraceae bacterium]|nr:hypothetical protein [Steroidobacteraceae bacterium]